MSTLRSKLIHLAHSNPELRQELLPLLKTGAYSALESGWMSEAGRSFERVSGEMVEALNHVNAAVNNLTEASKFARSGNTDVSSNESEDLERAIAALSREMTSMVKKMVPEIQKIRYEADGISEYWRETM